MNEPQSVSTPTLPTSRRWRLLRTTRTLGRWAVEILLVLVIASIILATWMPAIVTHRDKQKTEHVEKGK